MSGDYDGDGKSDLAVFDPASAQFHASLSGGGTQVEFLGYGGSNALSGDYNNDGKADIACYRPDGGLWHIADSHAGVFTLNERYGTELEFDKNGRIAIWKDADNNMMSFTYNAQTNLQSVSDCFGRSLTFT